jgi:hypothetical protein
MLITKKRLLFIIAIIIILIGMAVFIIKDSLNNRDEWKPFKASLLKNEKIIDGVVRNQTAYLITSQKEENASFGDRIAVFTKKEDGNWSRTYENDFKDLMPCKLELADIDGDGKEELLTAVNKTVHYDKQKKNRMFIFQYEAGRLTKKWTGSQIAGEWIDFVVGDFVPIKGEELIFLKKTGKGVRISVHYWFDFGFLLLAESKDYENVINVAVQGENRIIVNLMIQEKKKQVVLKAKDNRLIEVTK